MPIQPGVWGDDYSAVVEAGERVTPADGRAMLRFLRADHEGKPPRVGCAGDVYRIIDLRDFAADIAAGESHLVMEARFASSEQTSFNADSPIPNLGAPASIPQSADLATRDFLRMLNDDHLARHPGDIDLSDESADTLAAFVTEFGRMPTFQKGANGRDPDPAGFTVWLAGAGVRRASSPRRHR